MISEFITDAIINACCDRLNNDVRSLPNNGIVIVASSRDDEPVIAIEIETPECNWLVGQPERPLSQAILDDNADFARTDELDRIIAGLRITIGRLEEALRAARSRAA